jgi:CBS domain containing-hemolysin-like protein
MALYELEELLGRDVEDHEHTTVGGYVTNLAERILDVGDDRLQRIQRRAGRRY